MNYELKTTCDFPEVWDDIAITGVPGPAARPVKEVGCYCIRHNGQRWQSVYLPGNEQLAAAPLIDEAARVRRYLLEELFPGREGLKELRDYCALRPGASVGGTGDDYNFYISGSCTNLWVRADPLSGGCHLCIRIFAK